VEAGRSVSVAAGYGAERDSVTGMRGKVVVGALMLVAFAAGCTSSGASTTSVTARTTPEGTTAAPGGVAAAPDFTVPILDGDDFSLAAHVTDDGRPVMLNLWASWCLPCREEMPAIDAAAVRHPGVLFIGVAVQDGRAQAAAFADEIGVDYPLGFDEDGTVDAGYRPLGLPATYIISGDGVLLEEFYGRLDAATIDQKLTQWFGG
jgi:cytochrome c biogenesis protein CcmG, thiol:disulfide interchange protein DsbE